MITDSHCHLGSERFPVDERAEVVQRAKDAGVGRMVTLATSLEDLETNLEIANDAAIQAAIGIHPCDVHHAPDDAVERVGMWAGDVRVCAVGETGLDYFHPAPDGWSEIDYRNRQKRFLRQHFELAVAAGLNVVIHTRDREGRDSFEDAFAIYEEFSERVRAVFHCFISEWELAERVIGAGGLVSFGGVATFKNAGEVREVVKKCPAGSFMLETDSPYLAPVPMRGKRNEPGFTMHTAKVISEIRREGLEELAVHTELAVNDFFRWAK